MVYDSAQSSEFPILGDENLMKHYVKATYTLFVTDLAESLNGTVDRKLKLNCCAISVFSKESTKNP